LDDDIPFVINFFFAGGVDQLELVGRQIRKDVYHFENA
jgi:hypothetical protein